MQRHWQAGWGDRISRPPCDRRSSHLNCNRPLNEKRHAGVSFRRWNLHLQTGDRQNIEDVLHERCQRRPVCRWRLVGVSDRPSVIGSIEFPSKIQCIQLPQHSIYCPLYEFPTRRLLSIFLFDQSFVVGQLLCYSDRLLTLIGCSLLRSYISSRQ